MDADLQTKLENIKSLIDQILSAEGGGEELMKALKEFLPEDEKDEKEEKKAKKQIKKQEEEEEENENEEKETKAKKELTNTPSDGTIATDSTKETFEDVPEDVEEAVDEIKKSVLSLTGIVKEIADRQKVLTKSVSKLLEGMGIVKELGFSKPENKVEKKEFKNSDATPNVADSINEIKKTLEMQGIIKPKTESDINAIRKSHMSDEQVEALVYGIRR